MKRIYDCVEQGNVTAYTLVASTIVAFLAIVGVTTVPSPYEPKSVADMHIEPEENRLYVGETFAVDVVLFSSVPVNVFAGEVQFDQTALQIQSIDYNISVAELWTERPWYDNGQGTLNFAGGTYKTGGFVGEATLITITFKTLRPSETDLTIHAPRVLLHDGLGSDANLRPTIDSIVTVDTTTNLATHTHDFTYAILQNPPSTDLNGDGKQTIADISIFMINITGNNPRFDFNLDGDVNLKDLNILMSK